MMYTHPESYGYRNNLKDVTAERLDTCRDFCQPKGDLPCDRAVFNICCNTMLELNINVPKTPVQAQRLYRILRMFLRLELNMHF